MKFSQVAGITRLANRSINAMRTGPPSSAPPGAPSSADGTRLPTPRQRMMFIPRMLRRTNTTSVENLTAHHKPAETIASGGAPSHGSTALQKTGSRKKGGDNGKSGQPLSDELKAAANFGLHLREEQLTANTLPSVHVEVTILRGEGLRKADLIGRSDPFVWVVLNGRRVKKTATVDNTSNPKWSDERIELDSRKIAQSLYDEVTEVKSDLTDVKKDLREVLTLLKTKGLVVA